MATRQEITDFLTAVQRRAFKQAAFAVRDDDTALDVVQDAMIRLTEKYSDKPAAELPLLFQRILQNVINDHFRRQKVRGMWTTLLSALRGGRSDGADSDADRDPLDTLEAEDDTPGSRTESAGETVEREQIMGIIEDEIARLPRRQREAFLMRYWEDMDVAETAVAMGCSEGSVKTHCSRATHSLAATLKARGISI